MFEPVNDLERSLMKAATDPSARPQFYRDLLAADIFVVNGGSDLNVQNNVVQQGSQLMIQQIEMNGKSCLPVFTSLQRLQQFIRSEARYLQLKARDFFEITNGAHVFLNPGFAYGKEFLPQEIAQMLDGSIFKPSQTHVTQKETQVLIGQPAVYPAKLVKALSDYFAGKKQVNRAYLVQFFNPETDEKPHLLIGIDAGTDYEKVVGDAGLISSEVMGKGEIIDFMRLGDSGLSRHMIEQARPFYEKKSFLKKLLG